jgi:hypothetical protein
MEKGCVMEHLLYGWMPPQYVLKEYSGRNPGFEDMFWFEDEILTVPIPSEGICYDNHYTIYTNK